MYTFNKDTIVRLLDFEIRNFKSTEYGKIEIGTIDNFFNNTIDLKGIYGQNGSGKTSIVDAASVLKTLFSGESLSSDLHEYITHNKTNASISASYFIKHELNEFEVYYAVGFKKKEKTTIITNESIKYRIRTKSEKWSSLVDLIVYNQHEDYITPQKRAEQINKLYKKPNDFLVHKILMSKESKSLFFSDDFLDRIRKNNKIVNKEYFILNALRNYSSSSFYVIDNKQLALSDANLLLPINLRNMTEDGVSTGVIPIQLNDVSEIPEVVLGELKKSLHSTNLVLKEIIPNLQIEVIELTKRLSKEGEVEVLIELVSCRNEMKIPIRYESDGIKKIISVLHLLIALYNNQSMTVFIDELDSGIFEYLLGEILGVLEDRGQGQLIFTSHNLRPLEVLEKDNLVFSTTNSKNRFIQLKNIKTNNNVRDVYYRDIILDGQKEELYNGNDTSKIAYALKKAGNFIE